MTASKNSNMDLPPEYISAANDLRSDTFTTPTEAMIKAALNASVGDAVYGEDVDTARLEQTVARLAGKEAGLFCVSGTMSNQIALRTHLYQPPYSILCDYRAHVYTHESAGLAILSQAMVVPVIPSNGNYLTLEDIKSHYVPDDGDIHGAPTKVLSLENTLHGIIYPLEELVRIKAWCMENGMILHCDGARIWNAVAESKVPLKQFGEIFDSISICLSKSMGAPIGSILVGNAKFIRKANHFRKQQGGGIRQSGMISRMALVNVDSDWKANILKSHALAHDLAAFCKVNDIPMESPTDTNFVFIDLRAAKMNPDVLVKKGLKYNVKLMGGRISFHYQVSTESLANVKQALLEAFEYAQEHPFDQNGPTQVYRSASTEIDVHGNAIQDIKGYKY
ncbi:similar to Saccharomyces cerevisiae YEL046C GLY1 Threonine aldolase, catalyzes the cleavage of L-allo-threonine and L-threonine to glycine [Maudiozyma barnettii]|uniref:low-specificity L-threonine aldolase n=1 Tax=Maudiozyma barnettii TaxID=61262 RepID=A0A8H2VB98_9SACH|nr:threonine aldolase GLY1 [Kazachstania barnettii]CAB4252097.1 similar to Saccharomyces cerevisiae YEL046C GLY1 Threonine aldolase, catalyzes the cleavage of L-allo-threonine and L-threonine to glycine [Kazachstania barnettii]CAD1778611.1 similar to Saccharomyces cerevisiae YEL046C GLY1 Threonine aldolase, catalyzes the cleavage of L-allo-threonine and L-threonine to glycine [Kazachstania barnettii]